MLRWTPKVAARAALARLLLAPPGERARAAGLTMADLQALASLGDQADDAQLQVRAQAAEQAAERTERKEQAQQLFAEERALRDRLVAVVGELLDSRDAAEREQGMWLHAISFERYRLRVLRAPAPAPDSNDASALPAGGAAEELPASPDSRAPGKRQRVARTNLHLRLDGFASFAEALLKPARQPIVERLAARGLSRELLAEMRDEARALAGKGRNVWRPIEATAQMIEAMRAQRLLWRRVQRMVRRAVAGDRELERAYAEC